MTIQSHLTLAQAAERCRFNEGEAKMYLAEIEGRNLEAAA